jgi:hypothetical protein
MSKSAATVCLFVVATLLPAVRGAAQTTYPATVPSSAYAGLPIGGGDFTAPVEQLGIVPVTYPTTNTLSAAPTADVRLASATGGPTWISPEPTGPNYVDPSLYPPFDPADEAIYLPGQGSGPWHWQLLPDGLIYRSYMAGPREPRISTLFEEELSSDTTYWDGIVGGRMPVLRFGNDNPLQPEGWELDIEGAAIVRLNLDATRDVDASDFRFGFPITYGVGQWQYKFGYYHLSSHLGDEFIARTPGAMRINYVRDAIIAGVSYNPTPWVRLYGETAYAFFTAGGAEPWEFQFGTELAQPGRTGPGGTPFLAVNAHLREEINFSGDFTVQAGWLWRGDTGHMLRTGVHLMTGKSTQYQFHRDSEQQLGVGLWYDY